jgi:lysophospholipase L1-like esterase
VVDQGISGNRVLADGAGASAQARLDRDVLTQRGARVVIFLEGINDIGFADLGLGPPITAADLIAGYHQIITHCHDAGLSIIGGTWSLPPCGSGPSSDRWPNSWWATRCC